VEKLWGSITAKGPGYVFARVECDGARQDFFIHHSEFKDRKFSEIRQGDGVEFTPVEVAEGKYKGMFKGVNAKLMVDFVINSKTKESEENGI